MDIVAECGLRRLADFAARKAEPPVVARQCGGVCRVRHAGGMDASSGRSAKEVEIGALVRLHDALVIKARVAATTAGGR